MQMNETTDTASGKTFTLCVTWDRSWYPGETTQCCPLGGVVDATPFSPGIMFGNVTKLVLFAVMVLLLTGKGSAPLKMNGCAPVMPSITAVAPAAATRLEGASPAA